MVSVLWLSLGHLVIHSCVRYVFASTLAQRVLLTLDFFIDIRLKCIVCELLRIFKRELYFLAKMKL